MLRAAPPELFQWKDLRGKRIGTFPRTSSSYYLSKELEAHGLTEKDVEVVGLAPIFGNPKAIIEKRVDAIDHLGTGFAGSKRMVSRRRH
jgi:ABC-type nitrate/sulfonate/bicarbonate transport system substrate-binding protein